ncbi:MAG: branched-chain amino acid ABC transporter permease, partial [Desulfobacterales bacterium]|nr:branched-chain amino acid ABC transporter permease [Desulfobacterales bacterium]
MDYVFHVLVLVALYVILATSFNLLIGYAGLFALSHAVFFAIGAYATAILSTSLGLPFPVPLIIGIALAAVVSLTVALPALRIGGDYLVIASLALQMIAVAVMTNWTALTGGTDGIRNIPRIQFGTLVLDTAPKFFPLALAFAVATMLFASRLGHSPFGRALKAVREDETAAQSVGKN